MLRLLSRRQFLTRAAALPLLPSLSAFALRAQAAPSLTVAMPALPDTLDPHVGGEPARLYTPQVFDSLVVSADLTIRPALAESWTVDDDGATFTLRAGVTFQNGEPFDAAAVVFNVERALAPDVPERAELRALMGDITRVDALDALTVRIDSATPQTLLARLTYLYMVAPEHTRAQSDDLRYEAWGTGAFQVVAFQPARTLDLAAHPDYWGDTSGAIQTLQLAAFDDPTRLIGTIQRGTADIVAGAPMDLLAAIARIYPVATRQAQTTLIAQFHAEVVPELADERVRGALNLALDRALIADVAFGGYAEAASQITPRGVAGYDLSIRTSVYDTASARDLLAEAGVVTLSLEIGARTDAEIKTAAFLLGFWEGIGMTGAVVSSADPDATPAVTVSTLDVGRFAAPLSDEVLPLVYPQTVYIYTPGLQGVTVTPDGAIHLWQVARV
ncbi:MAG: ABC transporter substrate-binding protein [Chloroflexota bacterium]|nr:ABC transporter substrate-binding protein [Chloroflexota bacterium]